MGHKNEQGGLKRMMINLKPLVTPAGVIWVAASVAVGMYNAEQTSNNVLDPDLRGAVTWVNSATGLIENQLTAAAYPAPGTLHLASHLPRDVSAGQPSPGWTLLP